MASFNILNKQAFDKNPIEEFRRVAGGLPDTTRKYGNLSTSNKGKLFWDFFTSEYVTDAMLDAKTVYSGNEIGVTLREVINRMNDDDRGNNVHSIEHVVPKSLYKEKSNGASINPLNFMPSHSTVNSKRSTRSFDFDGDIVQSDTLARVDGIARKFQGGKDKDGEWVVPLVTRGDVARCVMYMEMMYDIEFVDELEMRKLQVWMKRDEPSDFERAFGLWLLETQPLGLNVQNPFVSNPELAMDDEMFEKLLDSFLEKENEDEDMVVPGPPPKKRRTPPPPSELLPSGPVVIDSVVANPTGRDVSGTEIITLRNTTRNVVDLEGWTLDITTQTRKSSYSLTGSLNIGEIDDFTFEEYNILSNSRQTTITLRDGRNDAVSEFQYSSTDATKPGSVLRRIS